MKKILSIFIFFFFVLPFGNNQFTFAQEETATQNCSLNVVLEELGISEEKQKEAFKKLCVAAEVALPENFDIKSLLQLVVDTQRSFTNSKQNQDEGEICPLEWMNKNPEQHLACIKTINLVTEDVLPSYQNYGAACLLGDVNSTMQYRMKYLEEVVNSGVDLDKIFLLSEARPVSNVDGSEEEILQICKKVGVEKQNLTEAHILQNIFENSFLSKYFTYVLINTPCVNGGKTIMQNTVLDFCQWRTDHNFEGKVLFISSQPNVLYQKAVIEEILEGKGIDFEVVGPKTNSQSVQTLVGALGSFIWASMPKIITKLGFKVASPEEIELVKSLYGESHSLLK